MLGLLVMRNVLTSICGCTTNDWECMSMGMSILLWGDYVVGVRL